MTPETTTNNQEIKNLSWLEKKIVDTSLDWIKIKKDLKDMYGIDIDKEVFNITAEELTKLKSDITSSNDKAKTIYENLFKEQIETKIQTSWIKEVSLDNALSWIKDKRVDNLKEIFTTWIDKLLEKDYPFLWERKEMFKLIIVNSLINWEFFNQINDIKWWLSELIKDLPSMDRTDVEHPIDLQSHWNNAKETFDKTIAKHLQILWEIKSIFDNQNPQLTLEEQKNVLSNIPNFNDPEKLEKLTKVDINNLLTPEFINQNKEAHLILDSQENSEKITDKLSKYMLKSRNNFERRLKEINVSWDEMMWKIMNVVTQDNAVWEISQEIIKKLLKIPVIWFILSLLLWLNKTDPVKDFSEKVWWAKLYKSFTENIQNIPNLKGLINIKTLNQKNLEPEFKKLSSVKPDNTKNEDFLKQVFWEEWYKEEIVKDPKKPNEKITVNLKIEITDKTKQDGSIDEKELKEMINKRLDKFKEEKAEKNTPTTAATVTKTQNWGEAFNKVFNEKRTKTKEEDKVNFVKYNWGTNLF